MNLRSDISKPSPIQKIEKVDKRHACSIHLHKLNMYIYSVSVNSGKPRFSGFFQVTKTKMDIMKQILVRVADLSIFQ